MIVCKHPDCNYKVGWVHKGGDNNMYLEGAFGQFYFITSGFQSVVGRDNSSDNTPDILVYGCPRCNRLFMGKEEYLDN